MSLILFIIISSSVIYPSCPKIRVLLFISKYIFPGRNCFNAPFLLIDNIADVLHSNSTLLVSADVEFIDGEPGAGIVGDSGLLLGLGKLQGMEGGCLMGETSGYMVDPKSASVVLKSLQKLLDNEIDLEELEKRAKQVDSITNQLKESESEVEEKVDVNYIG